MGTNVLVLAALLGVVCGLRSMTAPAADCWGAHFGWLRYSGTEHASRLSFIHSPVTLIVFTLFAVGELIADKLPRTPARTAPPGLITRIIFGAACGGALSVGVGGRFDLASLFGAVGAIAGTFGGYQVRRALTANGKLPDLPVALVEDVIAVVGAFLIVSNA